MERAKAAGVADEDRLLAVVVPHEGLAPADAKAMLQAAGLWFS